MAKWLCLRLFDILINSDFIGSGFCVKRKETLFNVLEYNSFSE